MCVWYFFRWLTLRHKNLLVGTAGDVPYVLLIYIHCAFMVMVYLSEVPLYLRKSPYFKSFNIPDCQLNQFSLDIPHECLMRSNSRIRNSRDFHHFLRTICFWECLDLATTSVKFLKFVFEPRNKEYCLRSFPTYEADLPILRSICSLLLAPEDTRIVVAAQIGCLALLRFLRADCINLETLCTAGRFGHVDCLKYLISTSGGLDRFDLCNVAVLENDVVFLRTAIEAGVQPTAIAATTAASKDYYDCLSILILNGCPVNAATTAAVAQNDSKRCYQLLDDTQNLCSLESIIDYLRSPEPTENDLSCLKFMLTFGFECTLEMFTDFIQSGRADCAVWLVPILSGDAFNPCNIAAQYGSVDCLMALRSAGYECAPDICLVAARSGKKDILIYLYAEGFVFGVEAITAAAEIGHFAGVELLHENDCPWDESTALAAGRGDLWCLKYVLVHGCPCAKTVFNTNAIAVGCELDTLKYLHQMGFPWDESTALIVGQRDLGYLEYVLSKDCPCAKTVANTIAIAKGDLKALKQLYKMGFPWLEAIHSWETSTQVPNNNSMEVLERNTAIFVGDMATLERQILHQQGRIADASATEAAARGGQLHILRYLFEKGYTWSCDSFNAAVMGDHLNCVEYMAEKKCPVDVMNAIDLAAQHGSFTVLKFLREKLRFPWFTSTCAIAASVGRLDILQYLHSNKCPWDQETCRRASTQQCMQYAVSNGCPLDTMNSSAIVRH